MGNVRERYSAGEITPSSADAAMYDKILNMSSFAAIVRLCDCVLSSSEKSGEVSPASCIALGRVLGVPGKLYCVMPRARS